MKYGLMGEKCGHHKSKITSFRKHPDTEAFNNDLNTAPWHVSDIFTENDVQYNYWKLLFKDVIDCQLN